MLTHTNKTWRCHNLPRHRSNTKKKKLPALGEAVKIRRDVTHQTHRKALAACTVNDHENTGPWPSCLQENLQRIGQDELILHRHSKKMSSRLLRGSIGGKIVGRAALLGKTTEVTLKSQWNQAASQSRDVWMWPAQERPSAAHTECRGRMDAGLESPAVVAACSQPYTHTYTLTHESNGALNARHPQSQLIKLIAITRAEKNVACARHDSSKNTKVPLAPPLEMPVNWQSSSELLQWPHPICRGNQQRQAAT
mmetsp:Transcript_13298/g.29079  ORF Transcript_13298/g.29079 Transcript_13298/m.29079 type:complete len:252 (+) Transcript_13298:2-757(+)